VSVGVKVAESVRLPAARIVPATGEYVKLPPVEAVALSCVPLNAVPKIIGAGVAQVTTGRSFAAVTT